MDLSMVVCAMQIEQNGVVLIRCAPIRCCSKDTRPPSSIPTSTGLLSVGKICDLGYSVVFEKTGCRVLRDKEAVLVGERSGGLYRLKQFPERVLATTQNHPELCEHLWHRRLGHRDPNAIAKIVRQELGFGLIFTIFALVEQRSWPFLDPYYGL